jgi:hypothetical protein
MRAPVNPQAATGFTSRLLKSLIWLVASNASGEFVFVARVRVRFGILDHVFTNTITATRR